RRPTTGRSPRRSATATPRSARCSATTCSTTSRRPCAPATPSAEPDSLPGGFFRYLQKQRIARKVVLIDHRSVHKVGATQVTPATLKKRRTSHFAHHR